MRCRTQYLLECYYGERLLGTSVSVEHSSESEEHVDQLFNQSFLGQLNFMERRHIRHLGEQLKRSADSFQIRSRAGLLFERASLLSEDFNDDEMQVVTNILSEKTPTTISKIAEHVGKCLTLHTFRASLQYMCYSTTSVREELAAACELVKVIYPRIQQLVHAVSIYDALREFIEKRLDEVVL